MSQAARRGALLHREELSAYEVGIEAARLLARRFPDFFAEQAAGAEASPARMLGCAAALFQLVERRHGLLLRWPEDDDGDLPRGDTPEDSIVFFDDVTPEFLTDVGYYLQQIRPQYYGDGVNLIADEGQETDCPLRLTLYWLFQRTRYSIGVEVEMLMEGHDFEDVFRDLQILPGDTDVAELCMAAAAHIPEAAGLARPGDLLRFAFGQTGNPLADTGGYEIYAALMGEDAEYWDWERTDLADLARLQAEARAIEDAFDRWARRAWFEGAAGVELLAELLHREAAALRRRDKRIGKAAAKLTGRPLVEVLGGLPGDHLNLEALTTEAP